MKKDFSIGLLVLLLLIMTCILLVIISESQMPTTFVSSGLVAIMSAVIGAILVGAVTFALLKKQTEAQSDLQDKLISQQSKNDREKEIEIKVFEEKLKIYHTFLTKLHNIIKDGKIDNDEARELIFQISYIRMHTHADKVKLLLEAIQKTIGSIAPDSNLSELANSVLKISQVMQLELYEKPLGELTNDDFKLFDQLVTDIVGNIETTVVAEVKSDRDLVQQFENKLKEAIKARGIDLSVWECEKGGKSAPFLILRRGGNGVIRHIGLTQEDKYNAYFFAQTHNTDMSVSMKQTFGGRRSGGGWWSSLKEPYMEYYNELPKFVCDDEFLTYLVDTFVKAIKFLDVCFFWDSVEAHRGGAPDSGSLRVWETNCLVIDYTANNYSKIETNFAIDVTFESQKCVISALSRGDSQNIILNQFIDKYYPNSVNSEGRCSIAIFDMDKSLEIVNKVNDIRKQLNEFLT